jgi:hypothetical protein
MEMPTSTRAAAALAATLALLAIAPAHAATAHNDAVEGYTATGDTVYRDGRVVTPNGSSFYPKNQRQSVACRNGSCSIYDSNRGYDGERPGPGNDNPAGAERVRKNRT